MGLKTTTIGSLPKPKALRLARWRFEECEIEEEALATATVAATQAALDLQQSLGLDARVDGQMDRSDLVTHFAEKLDGFEIGALVRCYGNRYYKKPRIHDSIAREKPLIVESWRAACKQAGQPLRAIVTGPYTMMDWCFDEHYESREACCDALAVALRQEVDALLEAGATEIQIDEPAIGARADEIELVARAWNTMTDGLAGRARRWLQLGYGDLDALLPQLLALPADVVMLGLTHPSEATLAALDALPASTQLAAGVIEAGVPEVESVDEIADRLRKVLAHVPADRVWATPDAGLRGISEEACRAKLEALVAAARSL